MRAFQCGATEWSDAGRREPDPHDRAAVRRVRGADVAAARLGRLAHDREPEARTRACRARPASGRSGRTRAAGRGRRTRARGRAPRARPRTAARPPRRRAATTCARSRARSTRPAAPARDRPRTMVSSRWRWNVIVSPARRSTRSHAASTIRSSRMSSTASSGATPRASSTMSAISVVSSSSSDTMSARSCSLVLGGQAIGVLERLDVRAQARDRRAQLVARILDQVPLRLDRAFERGERAVEAPRQPAELVVPALLEPVRRVGVDDHGLGAAREPGDRRERRARHERAEYRGEDDAGRGEQRQDDAAGGRARRPSPSAAAPPGRRRRGRRRRSACAGGRRRGSCP